MFGLWSALHAFPDTPHALTVAILMPLALCGLYFAAGRLNRAGDKAWQQAGTVLLGAFVVVTFVWAIAFDSSQASDFGIYYRCGTHLQSDLAAWMSSCRSHFFYQPDNTYWTRSLVYSAPFGVLLGDHYPLFKIYNASLHGLTMALMFFGLARLKGPRVATIALLVFGVYPEWFYSVTLATPDNLALLFVVSFLLLLPGLGSGQRVVLHVAGLAVLAFLANLARTIGPVMIITAALWALTFMTRGQWKRMLGQLAAIVVLYWLANVIFVQVIRAPSQGQFDLLTRVSTIDISQPGQDFRLVFAWLDQFLPLLSASDRASVITHKILLEFSHGFADYPGYLFAKASILFNGMGYFWFSSNPLDLNPDSSSVVKTITVPVGAAMPAVLIASMILQLGLAAFGMVRARRDQLLCASIFFMSMFYVVALGFGDTQSRYSLLIAPAIAIACAIALFPADTGRAEPGTARPSNIPWAGAGVLALAVFYAVGSVLAAKLALRIPVPLTQARQDAPYQLADGTPCNTDPLVFDSSYKRLKVVAPARSTCFRFSVPLPAQATSYTFFVSRDQFPFPFEERTPSPYHYRVEQQGVVLYDGELGKDIVRWHKFNTLQGKETAPAGPARITFSVSRTGPENAAEPFELWLLTPASKALN
ncbi:hypothetical protein D1006_13875 [Burkholderia stabilis]|uniref:Glycosyltransferase RgtA/B/C/D-like domain-containing protein n=1 Tax=Burkholderia stabilis TaxID=95485 RepID=A0A4Q2AUQ4_9BURK|nr:hypothetical protein D1006_13875 [Burkholderia stabilis]